MDGIRIKNLRLSFTVGKNEIPVLRNLEFFIPSSRITVLLGKSGCGKTSLLRVVQGLETAYSGRVDLQGKSCAMVFQEPRLFPWLTVEKNVAFGNRLSEDRLTELLKLVGLENFSKAYPHQLSGGMQSRVSLARALGHKADFLLMDEPFAALDAFTRENLQHELRRLYTQENFGVLFVTHSVDEALRLGHRIAVMGEGRILESYEIEDENRDLLSEKFIDIKRSILEILRR